MILKRKVKHMKNAKIVIGANYGDEGKGLAADYFASKMKGPILNVLFNGGAQRGHTVEFPNQRRHVFHHFGAGSFRGVVTCLDEAFMVNPLIFVQECAELAKMHAGNEIPTLEKVRVHAGCCVTTIYDMLINQIIEENRGISGRHGSCGCGILETRRRSENTDWFLHWGEICQLTYEEYTVYAKRICGEYIPARLAQEGIYAITEKWQEILCSKTMIENYWNDLQQMKLYAEIYEDWNALAAEYPNVIFEGAQGLALSENNVADFPHLTPSFTTSHLPLMRIAEANPACLVEICYITRTYFTRHGAGPLPTECKKENLNETMRDRTNVPNPFQGTLRYGWFDKEALLKRIKEIDQKPIENVIKNGTIIKYDADLNHKKSKTGKLNLKRTLMITHRNETTHLLNTNALFEDLKPHFDGIYCADTPYANDIIVIK